MDKNELIHSEKLTNGGRNYFFDLKRSNQGDLFLSISESKKTDSGFEHHRIMIFEEYFESFSNVLSKILSTIIKEKDPAKKSYSFEEIRQKYPQAYSPWTAADDSKLEQLYCEGKKVDELSPIFGRNQGAIQSRIKKRELKSKYGM